MTPRVSLLGMGGTISAHEGEFRAKPAAAAKDLGRWLNDLTGLEINPRDVARVSSRDVSLGMMWELAEAIKEEIRGGADGVVVTHGTDTLEETAYALSLLVPATVPVVVTGAMRTPASVGADGAANLRAALAVAINRDFAAFGPVVVFHDEIHLARWVSKTHSARVAAFTSPVAGPVGQVVEGAARALLGPPFTRDLLPCASFPDRRVEVVWAVAGGDGMIVDAIADRVDGVVVAGTGGGHVPASMAEALVRVVDSGRPVVLASRCASGHVLDQTYGGPGSESQLLSAGLLSAMELSPIKARLRLAFGLAAGLPPGDLFPRSPRS